ncbi:MAG: thiamine pyrophosphate-dependent enzyme, partial [Lapillicoccus sp.]
RNVNLTILLFNNEIYGLTKGQYSPTSRVGTVTKSTPMGSVDNPFNPVSLALGAEATFVARTMDSDRKHLTEVLRAATAHRGTSLVEIYQNCPIFNDGVFDVLKDRDQAATRILQLVDGEEIGTGDADTGTVVVRGEHGGLTVVDRADADPERIVRHDVHAEDPSQAFAISRLIDPTLAHVPMGIFRDVDHPTYDDLVRAQIDASVQGIGGHATDADLDQLLMGKDSWTVDA